MKTVLVITTFVLLLCVLIFAGLDHMFSAADREQRERESSWLAFSMQHHCTVSKPASFWESSDTWACDGGFEVIRRP